MNALLIKGNVIFLDRILKNAIRLQHERLSQDMSRHGF